MMENVMWLLKLVLKLAIFFTLFAFALNNQQDTAVHLFFGTSWRAPLVLIVLAAFAVGLAIGVLAMVPRWWKHRRAAGDTTHAVVDSTQLPPPSASPPHGI